MKKLWMVLVIIGMAGRVQAQLADSYVGFVGSYTQSGTSTVTQGTYSILAGMDFASSSTAQTFESWLPGVGYINTSTSTRNPNGTYNFEVTAVSGVSSASGLESYVSDSTTLHYITSGGTDYYGSITVPDPATNFSQLPVLQLTGTSFTSLQNYNPATSLTLNLANFSGTSSSGIGTYQNIGIEIDNLTTGAVVVETNLASSATSFAISSGTLTAGDSYTLKIKEVAGNSFSPAINGSSPSDGDTASIYGYLENSTSITFNAAPEPSDLAYVGGGVLVLLLYLRRKRQVTS